MIRYDIKRSKSENKGIASTKMELVLEQTQQGTSHEVSISTEGLGVESYQKKLNITKSQKTFPEIEFKEPYTPSYDLPGSVDEDLNKQKRVLRVDKLYKFSDGTLKSVRNEIHHRVVDFCLDYNKDVPTRKWMVVDQRRSSLMIELIDKHLREREIIRNLKRLVSARELKMDYKLMTRTV
ncbi:hypothetical protein Tco_0537450 [Tanacetum coccineum]